MNELLFDKKMIPFMLLLIIILDVLILCSPTESKRQILIEGITKKDALDNLRYSICKKGIQSIIDKKASRKYVHPKIIEVLEKNDYQELQADNFYVKMQSDNFCRVVVKNDETYKGLDVIIAESIDAELIYKISEIRFRRPKKSEIR